MNKTLNNLFDHGKVANMSILFEFDLSTETFLIKEIYVSILNIGVVAIDDIFRYDRKEVLIDTLVIIWRIL